MSGPPKDIEPSALWLKLVSAERPSKLVDFPRYDDEGKSIGQLRIRILTQEEYTAASIAAHETASKYIKEGKRGDLGYERVFSDAHVIEVLFRACRNPDKVNEPVFRTQLEMRNKLTTEECAALFDHYLTVQLELGPMALSMTSEEMDQWLDRLAEGGSAYPTDLLSLEQQKILLLYSAYQLQTLRKAASSAGTRPEESTYETNQQISDEPQPLAQVSS